MWNLRSRAKVQTVSHIDKPTHAYIHISHICFKHLSVNSPHIYGPGLESVNNDYAVFSILNVPVDLIDF